MLVLVAGFVGMFGLFALWLVDKRSVTKKKKSKSRKTLFLIGTVVSVGLIILGSNQLNIEESQITVDPSASIPASTKIKIDEASPLQYKVLQQKKSGESLRVTIITPETNDARIIAINDKVFSEFKGKARSLFIDYFGDEAISKIYFAKITDPKTSDKDKKNLITHYIALMTSSEFSGNKLFKISTNNSLLKTY